MPDAVRRLFFALWPPADVARRLHEAALSLRRACGGRAMRRESLHLTLAFLGSIAASRVVAAEDAANAVVADRFVLELDRFACWKHNRIAWAGCADAPAALKALAADLARNLGAAGFSIDTRPFAVHATLVRNADCAAPLPRLDAPILWTPDDFVLVESHVGPEGSRYEIVRRWAMH